MSPGRRGMEQLRAGEGREERSSAAVSLGAPVRPVSPPPSRRLSGLCVCSQGHGTSLYRSCKDHRQLRLMAFALFLSSGRFLLLKVIPLLENFVAHG